MTWLQRPRAAARRIYIAVALDLHLCAACRSATFGPPPCDHTSPIVVASVADVALWWRTRILGKPVHVAREIGIVDGPRATRALARGRSAVSGRLGFWVRSVVNG